MLTVALIVLAFLHEPAPADFVRFGELTPADFDRREISPMRECYFAASMWRDTCRRLHTPLYKNIGEVRADAEWRFACWDSADDLCNSNFGTDTRLRAAQRLRKLLGPVDYFNGNMPEPWPGGDE